MCSGPDGEMPQDPQLSRSASIDVEADPELSRLADAVESAIS